MAWIAENKIEEFGHAGWCPCFHPDTRNPRGGQNLFPDISLFIRELDSKEKLTKTTLPTPALVPEKSADEIEPRHS